MTRDPADSCGDAAEADLARREARAAESPTDPAQLQKLAQERDSLADEQDLAADRREEAALERRERAAVRDSAAVTRDRRSRQAQDDGDAGFPDRFLSGRDVDAAAGDRADALADERHAHDDRRHARDDRHAAAADRDAAAGAAMQAAGQAEAEAARLRDGMEGRTVIGQAQGLLMARRDMSADEAFAYLVRESQTRNIKLREVARRVVEAG